MRVLIVASASLLLIAAQRAPYALPEEPSAALPPGEGVELTQATCSACHSLDYIHTQPRGKGAEFWRASVDKMIKTYGAPIEPGDADAIAAYLARTYG